jgi:nitric oxide reductase NorQ protein
MSARMTTRSRARSYTRNELEGMSVVEVRNLAACLGVKSRKKTDIIAALASDYRAGAAAVVTTTPPATTAAVGPQDKDERTVWPQVPPASCDVNGRYISPPWYGELRAAAQIGHVELMGPAGSGKTLAAHHLAASLGKRLAVVTADGGLRKRDLVGQRELLDANTVFLASEFGAAARNGDWALIDEVNMAEADALAMLNGMLDRPGTQGSTFTVGGKAIEVHPDFRCVVTRNPGYHGTKLMNEALRDRFWSIEVPPLLGDGLIAMFKAHAVKTAYIDDAVYLVEALFRNWEQNRISYQISPRRALGAAQMAVLTEDDFRETLAKSILTKIDSKHERDAVADIISTAWRARDIAGK